MSRHMMANGGSATKMAAERGWVFYPSGIGNTWRALPPAVALKRGGSVIHGRFPGQTPPDAQLVCAVNQEKPYGAHSEEDIDRLLADGIARMVGQAAEACATSTLETRVAVKADTSKPRMGLIDPEFAEGLAKVLTFGEQKYATPDGGSNWRIAPGLGIDRVLDAADRHIAALRRGENNDPETGISHSYHAAACLMFAAHYIGNPDKFADDRRWMKVTQETQIGTV
ncbi:MAG: hypothetical protein [Caudoviricetes sp.]|nr:MAG: hypothetical protein [Caudoviricetes sp.]